MVAPSGQRSTVTDAPSFAPDASLWLSVEQQQVWRSWLGAVARINSYLDAQLRDCGLDLADYEVLVGLSESPTREARMSDLADIVHQSRSRLSHTVTRMEKAGLVTRRASDTDRRGVYAQLTDKGQRLLEQAAPGHVQAVRKILVDAADPADFTAMGRVMAAVLAVED
ncbi:MarR family winged helix-turn-helix transcriptional regulator [Aestuariimicrobium ganziense]|uniref:MarR family winged helix-turn-helix transcriptional regulator n=1 Tax=Aestuariimicrobium ganziense TaxID=2773677 RepID=UPI001940EBF2|nr:MarR family transcriptional regulator [Aestuariimicrobium ganziense]